MVSHENQVYYWTALIFCTLSLAQSQTNSNQHNGPVKWFSRFRPKTQEFLKNVSKMFELHVVTFGARLYAHTIATFIDPNSQFFSHRILSRDECFDSRSKVLQRWGKPSFILILIRMWFSRRQISRRSSHVGIIWCALSTTVRTSGTLPLTSSTLNHTTFSRTLVT